MLGAFQPSFVSLFDSLLMREALWNSRFGNGMFNHSTRNNREL